jgi:hypothetical protein
MHEIPGGGAATTVDVAVTVTVPVVLPVAIMNRLSAGELLPEDMFTLKLTAEAVEDYGLNYRDVFAIDMPLVSFEPYGERAERKLPDPSLLLAILD